MTLHFDELMIIGIALIPGAFVLAAIAISLTASRLELGAFAVGAWVLFPMLITGVALLLIGVGMELH
jgi:hypothetical protein